MISLTAKLYLDGTNLTISDGGLGDTYIFGQLHFHWGENDTFGSEHTIDSEQYPLEVMGISLLFIELNAEIRRVL